MTVVFKAVKDRATSTLAAGIDTSDPVDLTVATGEGAKFPQPSTDGQFYITIENEQLRCTARVVDVLTCVRAQNGTAAAAHAQGVGVELRIVAKLLSLIHI